MIKALHILDSLNRGGAETMVLDLCRNAKANGLDLTFVATGGGELEEEFRNSGTEFIRLNRRLPVDLSLASQLRRIIKERGINVVHSHQPVEALHLYLATRPLKTRMVLTLHGSYPGAKNELALGFVMPRIDAIVHVSKEMLRLTAAQRFDRNKNLLVIKNGADPKRLLSAKGKLRSELGLSSADVLLGMVANFYPVAQKDQMTICRALPRVFSDLPNAHFVFAGGRSESAPHLFDDCVDFCRERNIADRVHFLGKRPDIANVIGTLDLFVLSSLREGSSISVIEAMMMGVPCVISDIAALREISNDGKVAVLFRTGDAEDLATKLVQLVEDSEHRKALGSAARDWAVSQFGIENHIANLIKLYKSLLA